MAGIAEQLATYLEDLSIHDEQDETVMVYDSSNCALKEKINIIPQEMGEKSENNIILNKDDNSECHYGVCAICLNNIVLQETALVKGCEHAYCLTCILRWATCKKEPTCPQCKHPFEFLNIHRSLDGRVHDYMFEESVCLLLRASWFNPVVDEHDEVDYDPEYSYANDYGDESEDLDEVYLGSSSRLRIGNRRWGDNGYVRSGRQEARPVLRSSEQENDAAGSSSCQPRKKEPAAAANETVGRRAKRALKREAADKAAAAKHQRHLVKFGHK